MLKRGDIVIYKNDDPVEGWPRGTGSIAIVVEDERDSVSAYMTQREVKVRWISVADTELLDSTGFDVGVFEKIGELPENNT